MRHSFWIPALRWLVVLPSYSLVLLGRLLKWLVAPAALAMQLAIGVPLGLRRFRVPLKPRFTPVAEQDLPDLAWIALSDAAESLAPDGFIVQGDFRCDDLLRGGVIWLRLLDHPSSGIQASAAQITLKTRVRPLRRFVEFSTEFRDGRVLLTTNRDLPYSLPPPHYLARIQLKDVWEPRALHGLHRDLLTSLEQPVAPLPAGAAGDDPAARLAERHARYIRALLDRGWLRWDTVEPNHVRLGLWAAVASVWRQAWPLRDVYLRVSDARSRRLLARRGLDVRKLTGSAMTVAVGRQSVPAGPVDGVRAGHAHARILAGQIDPAALLETVVAELENESAGGAVIAEVRYSFRSYRDEIRRRIRRHCGFDLVLDPKAGALSATAAERDFDRASDDAEWRALTARAPFEPLIFDPWMRDLDQVLPAARTALAGSRDQPLKWDSASLYLDNRRLCWQIVAWADDDTPLFVVLDARSGAVLN